MFFEEFDLPAQVVLMDSFNTTNQGFLVVGEEEDEFFGKTSATGYSRLYIDTRAKRPDATAILDSVRFNLRVANVDGTDLLDQAKTLSVHKLQEAIQDTLYYNFDALAYDPQPFSSGEFVMGEKKDSTLSFAVDTVFANDIFSKMKLGVEFSDIFSFREYFPGIAVKGKVGDNSGFSIAAGSSTGMSVFYHYEGDTASTKYSMTTASSRSFNGIKSDRSGSSIASVQDPNVAYDLGSKVGMKAGLGLVIKLDTSPFDAFLDTIVGITFNQAIFEIGEIDISKEDSPPIPNMIMYFTDDNNKILRRGSDNQPITIQEDGKPQVEITDESGNTQPSVFSPAIIGYSSNTKTYQVGLTSYINALYRKNLTRRDWLLYGNSSLSTGDDFKRSLRQMIVGKSKIKVKIIYSKIR